MHSLPVSTFLRRVLMADALTCVVCGLLLMFGAGSLERLLGVPSGPMRFAGLILLPFAVFLFYLAKRPNLSLSGLRCVIIVNALWTADSVFILFSGWIRPTEFGTMFVLFQAIGVAAFAALEYFGLRKSLV